MDAVDVSVLLIAGRDGDVLQQSLSHLEQQSYPAARFEVLVVDQGSSRAISEILPRRIAGSPARMRIVPVSNSSITVARNVVLNGALGRWLLFLDLELLAGPRLVEQHVVAQHQHGGGCVVVGNVQRHPQSIDRRSVHHEALTAGVPFVHNQPLRFLDWRYWNLSVPREAVVQNNGFDELCAVSGLEDVELAWRLEQEGIQGFYSEEATAYAWTRAPMDEELARRYADGYSLWRVLDKTHSDILTNRYLGTGRRGASRAMNWLITPAYRQLCGSRAGRMLPVAWLCRKLSHHAVLQGYNDARRGKPPRYRPQF
ncbi:MAG: glycosyltransferase family A protein [Candidatus Hydrogenedentes bacterium]|nr:glycosyltransferase family A protein [Candidatus Hydrogenedentota bacterium]